MREVGGAAPSRVEIGMRGRRSLVGIGAALGICLAQPALAQSLQAIETPTTPLALEARGSFYVGGEVVEQSASDLGGPAPADAVTVNQMYVEYMVAVGASKPPVLMIHGAGLSGKSYDTTPDGRMGWFEYFVRDGHPTYVVDQVGRARSGFNQATVNRLLAGQQAAGAPSRIFRFGERNGVWTNFRFGPRHGEVFPDTQFPTEAAQELGKQAIPDMRAFVPSPNPTFEALATLSSDLHGAVLISHSQSGHFPMQAALLDPNGVRGIVALEPGTCGADLFSDEQIARLANVPTLILFGDHLPVATGFDSTTWQDRYDRCVRFVDRIKAAGGQADLVKTTDLGLPGNSHMLMQDRNSTEIADFVLGWIDAEVAAASPSPDQDTAENEPASQIWRRGSPPISQGPASNFIGEVEVQTPYSGTGGSRLSGATVTFQPGARTAWHRHPMGQTLIVTEGCGWTQAETGPVERICAGDVAWIGPGQRHWHGATTTTAMTHVTASESVEGQAVEWLEHVPEAVYESGPTP